jgi:hypothetical protein
MAIFGDIKNEIYVQVDDKTRIDCSGSYVSKGSAAITLVEIQPFASAGFVDVTGSSSNDWYLDYEYSTDGDKVVTLRITTDGAPSSFTSTISVLTSTNDKLLSNDSDLQLHEPDILKYIKEGRNSYLDVHRRARDLILDWLNENGHTDSNGAALTKTALINTEEFRKWSTYLALRLIFDGISNQVDDVFSFKAKRYDSFANEARDRAILRLDIDGSGTVGVNEGINVKSMDILRR